MPRRPPWRSCPDVAGEVERGSAGRVAGCSASSPEVPGEAAAIQGKVSALPRPRVEELQVAAEDLVGRLAGQRDRRVLADRLEQQVERGVHVAEARPAGRAPGSPWRAPRGRRAGRSRARCPGGRCRRARRRRARRACPGCRAARRRRSSRSGRRSRPRRCAPARPLSPSCRAASAVIARGVQSAGEQRAARHVGDQLAAHDVVQQRRARARSMVSVSSVCARVSSDQYRRVRRPSRPTVTTRARLAPRACPSQNRVPGRLDHHEQLAQPVQASTAGAASGLARIALGSEPNSTPSRGRVVVEAA